MAKGKYQIPFDAKGNLQSYYWGDTYGILKDNYEFTDTLEYVGYSRGRSSATICLKDSDGHHYDMFLSDFDDVMKRVGFNGKTVHGTWTFVKKGSNYGIKLA